MLTVNVRASDSLDTFVVNPSTKRPNDTMYPVIPPFVIVGSSHIIMND